MSELIDRIDLMEHLRACNENGRQMSSLYDVGDLIAYVERMPTASPWHRVEEPPKVSCKVIAYAVSNSTGERDVTTAYYKQRSSRFHITGRRSHWRVTHWMPIEPPKEE